MSRTTRAIGAVAMLHAAPALGQSQGTVEFGGFATAGTFNRLMSLNHGYGAGGHVGVFLEPRWSLEFEALEMRVTRIHDVDVPVGTLSGRLVAVPVQSGAFSLLVGAGGGAGTDRTYMQGFGANGLVGAKFALGSQAAFRVDGVLDWLYSNSWRPFQTLRFGFSFFRHPGVNTVVVEKMVPAQSPPATVTPVAQRPDSAAGEELARLQRTATAYRDLRDSLAKVGGGDAPPLASATPAATSLFEEKIHFEVGKSDLTYDSRVILASKLSMFRTNPSMRIVVVGEPKTRTTDA